MYTASILSNGESLALTNNIDKFQVLSITGLNPPLANINLTTMAGGDGGRFNSAYLNPRNIVITLEICGNIEQNRNILYGFFRPKSPLTFYYSNNLHDVFIDGYVESVECDLFTQTETMQISILCPYPYFKSVNLNYYDLSDVYGGVQFPLSIEEPIPFSTYDENHVTQVINSGNAAAGATFTVDIGVTCSEFTLTNADTLETLSLSYSFQVGDKIIITTGFGNKTISLVRGGTKTSIFGALQSGSTFFELLPGANSFFYTTNGNDELINVYVEFYSQWAGV